MPEKRNDDTRARIVDVVEALIMERGFNAISYQDVSDKIGIRKASIHYHFPSKADLGVAVIARYTAKLSGAMAAPENLRGLAFVEAFDAFVAVFAAVATSAKRVCLGGVLGTEFETLPEAMRLEVRRFYELAQGWLGEVLERGRTAGAFSYRGPNAEAARAIMSMLEGALIIGRALGDPRQVTFAIAHARRFVGLT